MKVRIKLECNSCGYAELVNDRSIRHCPECGSSDVGFETDPLAATTSVDPDPFSEPEPKVRPEPKPEMVPRAPSPPVFQQSRRDSGYRSSMSEGTQIRIVLGIIGLIMLLSAVGIFFSTGFGGLMGVITLAVIGVIFLAIATKGECCNGC